MPKNREDINFTIFTLKSVPLGVGVMEFIISLPYRCYMYLPNLVKIGLVVVERKILMEETMQKCKMDAIGYLTQVTKKKPYEFV